MGSMIYLDYAATTPQREEVTQAMLPYFSEQFGNPSSAYEIGRESKKAIMEARRSIASTINALDKEIYFTSGGTESNNWVIKTLAQDRIKNNGKCHIITDAIEHHAVLNSCKEMEAWGCDVTYLPVDDKGRVNPEAVRRAIRPDTALISVMMANNEIGTIQPVRQIALIAKERNIPFHVDAVQAYGHMPIDVKELGIDLMSVSGHKFYGPKGIGFLYIRDGITINRFMNGGMQEKGLRAGTENVASIVGMAKASSLAIEELEAEMKREISLRDYFINRIRQEIPLVKLNGADADERLANNINFSFGFVESESLLIMLDMKGICVSAGSACATGDKKPSHVLMAIGLSEEMANGTLRFTIGRHTTRKDLDYVLCELKEAVENLRAASIKYEEYIKKYQPVSAGRILY
ncbi:MAG: cysteine desulfurase [Lachnospiraceae bacterium]|nr:cysteine desulfurase [Lachnospiraceae bacterium]